MKLSRLLFVYIFLLFTSPLIAAHSNDIDLNMRREMFLTGTMPLYNEQGQLMGEFLVKYLPGAKNIGEDAYDHFKEALDSLGDYVQTKRFWQDEVWSSFRDGLRFARDYNNRHGLGALPDDYRKFSDDFNSVTLGEFGGIGRKAACSIKFGAKCVARPIIGAAVATIGLTYSLIVPPVIMMMPGAKSLIHASLGGILSPSVKMVWHLGAWSMTQVYTKVPPLKDSMIITWVPVRT